MRLFRSLQLPNAAKWQESTIPFDWTLTERAKQYHPTCVWWWGPRTVDEKQVAWCYLCDRSITPTSWGPSITKEAAAAILTHRDLHFMGVIPIPGGHTVATPTE